MSNQQCLILFRTCKGAVQLQSAATRVTRSGAAGVNRRAVKAVAFLPVAYCDSHQSVVDFFNENGVHIVCNGDELCIEEGGSLFMVECLLDENPEQAVDSDIPSMILTSNSDANDREHLRQIFDKTCLKFRRKGSPSAGVLTRRAIDEQNNTVLKNLSSCLKCTNGASSNLLSAAIIKGQARLVELLLDHGADVTTVDSCNVSPLHVAAKEDNSALIELLVERGALVDARDRWNGTPLHDAAKNNRLNNAKALLQHGANIGARRADGRTPLHLAAENGSDSSKLVQLLINERADVNATDRDGVTPLHVADNPGAVIILLDNGADLSCEDNSKMTPLLNHLFGWGNLAVVKTLLDFGASVEFTVDVEKGLIMNDICVFNKNMSEDVLEYLLNRFFVDVDFRYDTEPPEWFHRISPLLITFVGHLVSVMVLNLKASYGFDPVDFWEEDEQGEPLSEFKERCETEVTRMKSQMIESTEFSVYELVAMNEQQVARLLRNELVALDTDKLKKIFPTYGEMLSCAVEKGQNRYSWEEEAIVGCNFLSNDFKRMPDEIKENIVSRLSIVDILGVKRASALHS